MNVCVMINWTQCVIEIENETAGDGNVQWSVMVKQS